MKGIRKCHMLSVVGIWSLLLFSSPVFAEQKPIRWYESQVVGVLIGALVAFAAPLAHGFYERRHERNILKQAIKSEIRVSIKNLENLCDTTEKLGKVLREAERVYRFAMPTEIELRVIDSNLGKLGLLDEKCITKIVEFRSLLVGLYGGIKFVRDLVPELQERRFSCCDSVMALRPSNLMGFNC